MYLHIRITVYILPDWEGGLYGPQKSMYTFSNLNVVDVMHLSLFTALVDLLPTHKAQILSKILLTCRVVTIRGTADSTTWVMLGGLIASLLEALKLLESIKTLAKSYYLLVGPRSIVSTSFEALTICVLLTWASLWYQMRIRLFWLIRYISQSCFLTVIAFADITWPSNAWSSVKRFWFLLA